jgi:hypothetical protein
MVSTEKSAKPKEGHYHEDSTANKVSYGDLEIKCP